MQHGNETTPRALNQSNEHDTLMALGFPAPPVGKGEDSRPVDEEAQQWTGKARMREFAEDERGAVTAEYALVIMAAVAFAGLLIAILRSDEVRSMLVDLVQRALGSAG